ncbi:hypothetical protein HMPREF3291_06530 [Bacillus sp. HMSC76G11]|nr:hypothetical protein HMPREF3291_06530 [Bacillus sp. HMSC76G11]
MEEFKITKLHTLFLPTKYIFLEVPFFNQFDLSSLRLLVTAGAPMAEVTKKRVLENFHCNFTEFYGTTEVSLAH